MFFHWGSSPSRGNTNWNALDHFNPTSDTRRLFAQDTYLLSVYDSIQDGWDLVRCGNWTYLIEHPGSNGTATEMGIWSVSRSVLEGISSPYTGTTVRNLFYPYENYTLQQSRQSYYNNSKAPWFGCLSSITMPPFGFKAFVPINEWVAPPPALARFLPGHDARITSNGSAASINISLEYSAAMNCDALLRSTCRPQLQPSEVQGVSLSAWSWSAALLDVPDGIPEITITNAATAEGASTNSTDRLLLQKGLPNNMVFPDENYDSGGLQYSDSKYTYTHKALGADMFRYSWNFAQNWSDWTAWEDVTTIPSDLFNNSDNWWEGQHIMVQYWSYLAQTSSIVIHSDHDYSTPRRVPQFLISVFGFNNYFYGDVDGDGVMDRLPPNTLSPNYLNMSAPPKPHLAWNLVIDDANLTWYLEPVGESPVGAICFALLLAIPFITGALAVAVFMWSFYRIKYNKHGVKPNKDHSNYFPIIGHLGNKSKSSLAEAHTPPTEKMFGHKHHEIIGWPEDKNKRRKVLIATLEYEIIDWELKVKIGGLGVMSGLMGKAMTDVDMVCVVPKVKDLEYPPGEPAEPIEVIIFGEPPVFRAQTKADPYPTRMNNLSSAIFYSTWNQAIAATVRRYPDIDIYHVNDYHEEMKEVCSAFNISKEHCIKYVQFGNTFSLLHAAASFISVHQKGVGVAGVSDKYGKCSWARYPALWMLKRIDSLPNPDPTDIAAPDENPMSVRDIKQAQEWAGIKQDPNADLLMFVGRWSKQKGVDLIADPRERPSIQLITVGPVIDLYGRFAAEKLAWLMELHPNRVYSKPEFPELPPYLFSGADFALIPSRDEPFGLVAVEFGRKGALGVGSRLGGLVLMPGWWFPVESTSTEHMMSQLTKSTKMALKSTEEERAILRARSAVQRFPVVELRQRMEYFHKRSITMSRNLAASNAWRPSDAQLPAGHYTIAETDDWDPEHQADPSQLEWDGRSADGSPGTPRSPGQWTPNSLGQWSQDTLAPALTFQSPFHRHFIGACDVHARLVQTLLGHGHFGKYYQRFVPTESPYCPCGGTTVQTRSHILRDCPLHDDARIHLRQVSPALNLQTILTTKKGLTALSRFPAGSTAFTKSVAPIAVDLGDSPIGMSRSKKTNVVAAGTPTIRWDDDSLTWALISAIQDDKGIKRGLYPPPGQNASTALGGGKVKTEHHWALCKIVFGEHEQYREAIAAAEQDKQPKQRGLGK
ncbi:glycosyltransferase family 5 protein [Wolfiporia cocos MD-104 SS10]|uniref:Glycosyltransferase family 5 protein n=1 Tax=Wolfiporia cocos (strain MD-104) TaxID=742152 RepID=A0A2H3JVG9_WOLCO|nr:glycosyltransferase family 5 protein [Wolfiporia cocos MD-104 SS10]